MNGIILTGHGRFASGLADTARLLFGRIDLLRVVDFTADMAGDELERRLRAAVEDLADCDAILILTDLVGGTPFKASVMVSMEDERIHTLTGTNLPLLLQLASSEPESGDVGEWIKACVQTAAGALFAFEKPKLG